MRDKGEKRTNKTDEKKNRLCFRFQRLTRVFAECLGTLSFRTTSVTSVCQRQQKGLVEGI